jgi:hypothetical protein
VVKVNAVDAWEEGINFYDRKSLYLSGPIPTHFLEVGDVRTDGYGEEEGGDRGPSAAVPTTVARAPRGDSTNVRAASLLLRPNAAGMARPPGRAG